VLGDVGTRYVLPSCIYHCFMAWCKYHKGQIRSTHWNEEAWCVISFFKRKYMDFWILRAGCTTRRQLDDGHCKLSLSSLIVIHIILP
jgi:hypothetical protein